MNKQKGQYGVDLTGLITVLAICAIFGLWKLVDILIWVYQSFSFNPY